MDMPRLLISDVDGTYARAIGAQLKKEYLIESCSDGERALSLLREFDPDVFILDLRLPKIDGLSVLRSLRTAGYMTKVIVLASFVSDYIYNQLSALNVSNVLMLPASLGALINTIRDLSMAKEDTWDVETAADRMLIGLGFNIGRGCYQVVRSALLYVYHNPNCFMTKCLYPDLAKIHGGTKEKIEKAIRDGIKDAFHNGDREVWYLYFPNLAIVSEHSGSDKKREWPTNETFLNRIVNALQLKERKKKPYIGQERIAQ